MLIISTDRISAFDYILPNGIPDKGRVLTQLSRFWFEHLSVEHHLVSTDVPASVLPLRSSGFAGRAGNGGPQGTSSPLRVRGQGISGRIRMERLPVDRFICGISITSWIAPVRATHRTDLHPHDQSRIGT